MNRRGHTRSRSDGWRRREGCRHRVRPARTPSLTRSAMAPEYDPGRGDTRVERGQDAGSSRTLPGWSCSSPRMRTPRETWPCRFLPSCFFSSHRRARGIPRTGLRQPPDIDPPARRSSCETWACWPGFVIPASSRSASAPTTAPAATTTASTGRTRRSASRMATPSWRRRPVPASFSGSGSPTPPERSPGCSTAGMST